MALTKMPLTLYRAGTLLAAWLLLWLLLGSAMLPRGAGFSLLALYLTARWSGLLVARASRRLPPLLGMLVAGLVLRNLPGEPLRCDEHPLLGEDFAWWSNKLRSCALAIIMLRAGLGLDLAKLRKMGLATARLAFCPCLAEALVVALLSAPLLELPPAWGGTLGFVIAAVSPAVVVPGMLDLQSRGYGTAKGIPTMVVAAASFDDVLAIAGFGICLALASSTDADVAWLVLKAPAELAAGTAAGLALGSLAAAPGTHALGAPTRALGALLGAGLAVFGGKELRFSGGGALAAVVLGATASRWWGAAPRAPVQALVNALWGLAQPALFGLLGAAVDVRDIEAGRLGAGLGVLGAGVAARLGVTRLALVGAGLTPREARLVCVAWLPKATVQAAVGGAALDLVDENDLGDAARERAETVLTLSVLVILLTAPLGAIGIALFGPAWLTKDGGEGGSPAAAAAAAPARTVSAAASAVVLERADEAAIEEEDQVDDLGMRNHPPSSL